MYNITYTCVVGARSERVLRGPKDFFFRLTLLPRCPPTHTALHHLLGALCCPGPLSPRPDLLPCFSARSLSPPHALTRSLRFAVSSCLCWCVSLCACAGVCVSVSVSFVCLFPCLCVCASWRTCTRQPKPPRVSSAIRRGCLEVAARSGHVSSDC